MLSSGVSIGAEMKAWAEVTPAGTVTSFRKYANVGDLPATEIILALSWAHPAGPNSAVMKLAGAEVALAQAAPEPEAGAVSVATVHSYGVPGARAGPPYAA